MKRFGVLAFGLVTYLMFLGTFLYAMGFLGNFAVPKSIDSAPQSRWPEALLVDALLLGIFAVQHSVMARPWFKRWWMQFIPSALERSTYVLFSIAAMILLFWQWRPMGGAVWNVGAPAGRIALQVLCAGGWILVLVSTFLINHFDLFGLRQAWLYWRGMEYRPLKFGTPGPYRLVRHPLYVGWLTAFWATPSMSVAHLVFAIGASAYILVAIQWEEGDLLDYFGETYAQYRRRVPMLLPRLRGRFSNSAGKAAKVESRVG